jgi:hypothetical protein
VEGVVFMESRRRDVFAGLGSLRLGLLTAAILTLAQTPASADGDALIMPGFSTGPAVQSYLRISNSDGAPHSVVVMLHNALTGEMLGTWTGPPVPAGGTFEAALADMVAGSDPPIDPERLPRSLVLGISGLSGHVQHAARTDTSGAWSNVTTCGMAMMADPLSLPYVSGPARTDLAGFIRITNGTNETRSLRMFLNDSSGAVSTWESPSIPASGAAIVAMSDIAAQAVPPIAPTVSSLMVMGDAAPFGISLSYMEGLAGSGTFDDFSAACMIAISAAVAPMPVDTGGGIGGMPGMTEHPQ